MDFPWVIGFDSGCDLQYDFFQKTIFSIAVYHKKALPDRNYLFDQYNDSGYFEKKFQECVFVKN